MSSRDPAMSEAVRRVLARLDPQVRDVANLTRLSAGATNETWSLDAVRDAGAEPLILRRSAVGRGPGVLTLQAEAQVLSAVHGCGVPVPEVRYVLAPDDALGEGFLMQRIAGATLPGKILRDPALATVRSRLASQLGTHRSSDPCGRSCRAFRSCRCSTLSDSSNTCTRSTRRRKRRGRSSSSRSAGCASICRRRSRRRSCTATIVTAI